MQVLTWLSFAELIILSGAALILLVIHVCKVIKRELQK